MPDKINHKELLTLTSDIVSSYVSNNTIAVQDIPGLVQETFKSLATVHTAMDHAPGRPAPAVPIKDSITPDYLICLEDGKKLKMLKRHLNAAYGMSPDEYRSRWGLPSDYPMVAPDYAKKRSQLAKDIGLGMARPVSKA